MHVRAALQHASTIKLSLMSFVIMDLRWVIAIAMARGVCAL